MLKLILLQILLLRSLYGEPIPGGHVCREPDQDVINRMRQRITENYIYMSPVSGEHRKQVKRFDVECPAYSTLDIGESLPLCPTYQELDSDNTRIPSDIIQTRCRCDHCVLRHRHRQQNLCKPVVRHIPVLRKLGCKDGIYEYGEFLEGVSVTCVCEIKPGSHEKHERARDSDLEESVNIMEESEPTTSGQYTNSRKMLDDFHEVAGLSDSDQLVVDNSPQQDPSTEYTDTEKMPG